MTARPHQQERRFAAQWSTDAMIDTDDLIALAERCEAASGPDRELDADLRDAVADRLSNGCLHLMRSTWTPGSSRSIAPPFTASLDAALALVGEKLPGWAGCVRFGAVKTEERANLWNDDWCVEVDGRAATPALALCAALLRALAANRKDTP